ncbi:MAG: glycine cleavage T C-terminal barrel domain-containing protein [Alphaproteobacteria bacterium]|nr:glycine cleavage T C-terminal barrel domain-containing protein [Alphaproteobacteria bacterium]
MSGDRDGAGTGARPGMTFSPRIRKSPYFEATRRWGCKAYTVYNHMYLPVYYESPVADFWRLVNDVAVWDVAAQRQLQIEGPDAARFTQHLTCRDISGCRIGQAKYVLLTDETGGIVNDPILLRLAEDRFWLSLADSDALLWAKGLAAGGRWAVSLTLPDVSPMQVQGPRSVGLMRDLFGDRIDNLEYFRFFEAEVDGIPVLVSRTGWSGERGYEVFLRDSRFGDDLWERIMAAGRPHNVAPGGPSAIRRIEAAMLSYGADMGLGETPFEIGLDRLVSLRDGLDYLAKPALQAMSQVPPARRMVGLEIAGDPLPGNEHRWRLSESAKPVGKITSAVYSPRLEKNIALALVESELADLGRILTADCDGAVRSAEVVPTPFFDPRKSLAADRS